jgi:tol-pal system protein YbgF
MMIKRCIILCVLLVSFTAYAANDNELLLDKIDRLENQVLLLEKKVSDLKHSQADQNDQTGSISNDASLHSRLLAIEEKMRELNGKFEYSDHTFQQILERIRNLSADVDYRFKQMEQGNSHNQPLATSSLKENNSQNNNSLDKYQEMINKGQYSKAITALQGYIDSHSKSDQAGEAYYLIGAAYSKQKLYDKAAINYLKGYKSYPKNPKAADSLLDLATALSKINKVTKACDILNKLEKEYPDRNSDNKQKTVDLAGKLACK